MKVIAFYLPQFYEFPENDMWWGEGFTEWTNVKKSKPLFKNHYQPTIPLNGKYYSLNDKSTLDWQVDLARKYGVHGFCFYHYWFGEGRQLMEKPVDMFLRADDLDLPFCLCWANHNWSRTWTGGDKDILMDMRYGDEIEWRKHFDYLLPYFRDKRYIQIDGKPIFVIYLPQDVSCFREMKELYSNLAIENGLNGITFIAQYCIFPDNSMYNMMDYFIQYEPNFSLTASSLSIKNLIKSVKTSPFLFYDMVKRSVQVFIREITHRKLCQVVTYDYDAAWDYILKRPVPNKKTLAGAFARCDVSPRRQKRAVIYKGDTPDKFCTYMAKLIKKVRNEYKQDYIFLSAWNEWGEGMYIEPDEKHQYGYLKALHNALVNSDE